MIGQARRIAGNDPIIDVINLNFQIKDFGRKKKSEIMFDEEVDRIVLLGVTSEQHIVQKLKGSNNQNESKEC
jgi:hypothetical protein